MKGRMKRLSAKITALLMILQLTAAAIPFAISAEEGADIIKSVMPSDGSTDVTNVGMDATSLIKIEFNEAMNPSTLDKDSVVVTRGTTVIDYTPIINDGSVYAIDPADLANESANGGSARDAYPGVRWDEYANQNYTITLKTTAELADGGSAVSSDLAVTSFDSLYFVDIPYEEGKYIDNVGAYATIKATATSGTNKAPQTLLTNPDVPYNNNGDYSILNPNRNLSDLGTITLDKAYDVAGIMVRTRYNASSAPSWNGVTFKVGDSRESATSMLYTGFGGSNDTAINNSTVLGNFANGLSETVNGQYVYLDMEAAQLFFPNKIWIYAYVDMPEPEVVDEDVIESIIPADGATNVTNVGVDATKLIEIKFKKEMDTLTLNKDTVIIKRGTFTVDYTPLVNDGYPYIIDPAYLAPESAEGTDTGDTNTGAHWSNEFYGQNYTISIGKGARQIDGTLVTNTVLPVSSFKSDYFINIPYAEDKYIENVGTKATIEVVTQSSTNREPKTLLTNLDVPYDDNAAYVILNPDKNLTDLATITLDKVYDVAGIMVRTRANASSTPSWNGGIFAVGSDKDSATVFLNTGSGLDNTRVLGGFRNGLENSVNSDKVFVSINTNQLFFPNKIWVYAYVDSPEKFERIYSEFICEMADLTADELESVWTRYHNLMPEFFDVEIEDLNFAEFADEFVLLRDLSKTDKNYDTENEEKETACREYMKLIKDAYLLDILSDGDEDAFQNELSAFGETKLIEEETDSEKFAKIYVELKENVKDTDTFRDVMLWSERLAYLENGTRSDIANTLSKYSEELGVDLSYGESKKVTIEEVAVKFDTKNVSKFYKCLNDEYKRIVDLICESDKNGYGVQGSSKPVGGGSGGGGGGGGSAYVSNTKPATPIEPTIPEENDEPVASEKELYSDMEGFEWAKTAVNSLSELNVINGDGEGRFNPQSYIKREEFVKMIVMAMGMDAREDVAVSDFADCSANDWFYPYVMIARQNKLINGISEYMFGSGQDITREDAAVIIQKVTKAKAVTEPEAFKDSESISDYAKDSVEKMASAGLLCGFEDGSFRPKSSLTRAEAAVLIQRMLEYTKGGK